MSLIAHPTPSPSRSYLRLHRPPLRPSIFLPYPFSSFLVDADLVRNTDPFLPTDPSDVTEV